jgi:hypothetical protein
VFDGKSVVEKGRLEASKGSGELFVITSYLFIKISK